MEATCHPCSIKRCSGLSPEIIVIDNYQELLAREAFEPSLAFHPQAPRHFGAVIAPYRFLERVECGIASCRQPHLSGYLVTTSDSKETAIGIDCGKTHFGTSFSRERKRVDAAVARKRRIETVTRMIERMAEVLPVVEDIHRQKKQLSQRWTSYRWPSCLAPNLQCAWSVPY